MQAILVFIDGTICDASQRYHLGIGTPEFYQCEEMLQDAAVPGSVQCLQELAQRYELVYIGARPVCTLPYTEEWLSQSGFPMGYICLGETQTERLALVRKLREKFDFIAGIGDRWDDNELHLEIGCLSIILQEHAGDWVGVPQRILDHQCRQPVITTMLNRKSIRHYTSELPPDEIIKTIVRAGQQAPFAGQMGSVLLARNKPNPWNAPLLFTICVDLHRLELIMARRGWKLVMNDLSILFFGIQDAALMAENMVIAAESLGLGSCFLGGAPYQADRIVKEYRLPKRVFPLVQLVMGYPAEAPPPRPRYPLDYVLFEDTYPELSEELITWAMKEMDKGYLKQDYYRKLDAMVELEGGQEERYTYDTYSWTEHMSRKWGQWFRSADELLEQLRICGFEISTEIEATIGLRHSEDE
jgi:nitroreductase